MPSWLRAPNLQEWIAGAVVLVVYEVLREAYGFGRGLAVEILLALAVGMAGMFAARVLIQSVGRFLNRSKPARVVASPPDVKVRCLARYRDFANYLEVENTGGPAEFVAQIQAWGNNRLGPYPSEYFGYWEEARGRRATILQGQRDRLLLKADAWPIDEHGEQKHIIKLFYADPDSREPKVQDSTQWGSPVDVVWLRVTISSVPPLLSGPFDETYQFPPKPS
jgi:hypothetical protein